MIAGIVAGIVTGLVTAIGGIVFWIKNIDATNKRIDDLTENTDKHLGNANKRIDDLTENTNRRIDDMRQDINKQDRELKDLQQNLIVAGIGAMHIQAKDLTRDEIDSSSQKKEP